MAGQELKAVLFIVLLGLCFLVLQTTFLPSHALLGSFSDLLLVLVCCLGLARGVVSSSLTACIIGFILGLLNRHFLVTELTWGLCGFFVGLSNNKMLNPSRTLAVLITAAGTFLMFFLYWTFTALLLKEPFYTAPEAPLLAALFNSLATYLIYPWFTIGKNYPNDE